MINKSLAYIVAGLVIFALGRYSVTSQVVSGQKQIDQTTQDHTKETIVRVKEPGGKTTTTVTINRDVASKSKEKDTIPVIVSKQPKVNISALVGTDSHLRPIYGVSLNKEFIGPVTIGVYGLTSGVVGLSVGVDF